MQDDRFARFPTTRWSLVGRAGFETSDEQRAALNDLLIRYLPALKAHLCARRRIDANEADDFVQGFIENKVLERHLILHANAERGKFRTLLATALDNYVANQFEKRGAKKRAHEQAHSLDDEQHQHRAVTDDLATDAFDVEWARQILSEVMKRMQVECQVKEREDLWGVFQGRILGPILHGVPPVEYDELTSQFDYKSPTQASNAQITTKRMFARTLREVISEYATDEDDVEDEIRDLQQLLAKVKR